MGDTISLGIAHRYFVSNINIVIGIDGSRMFLNINTSIGMAGVKTFKIEDKTTPNGYIMLYTELLH